MFPCFYLTQSMPRMGYETLFIFSWPGSTSSPVAIVLVIPERGRRVRIPTSSELFVKCPLDTTGVHLIEALGLESGAVDETGRVHGPLKRISLPAKDIVAMRAVAGLISEAPDKRMGPILGPLVWVVEFGGIPDGLVHKLGQADGVRVGAGALGLKGALFRVGDVASVAGAVEVPAVPARRESEVRHDAGFARRAGKVLGFGEASSERLEASKSQLSKPLRLRCRGQGWIPCEHAEALLEGRDLGGLLIGLQCVLHVVDGHAGLGFFEPGVGDLRYAVVGAVAGLEIQDCGPIVGEVLGELARGAG